MAIRKALTVLLSQAELTKLQSENCNQRWRGAALQNNILAEEGMKHIDTLSPKRESKQMKICLTLKKSKKEGGSING
jgi:hypothetical protein